MLRGTKKQIIHLKNTESPLFEEAFFIVRNTPRTKERRTTMVEEAERLLAEPDKERDNATPPPRKEKKRAGVLPVAAAFSLGVLLSALLFYFL